ncbi:GGDEF domain-containing protein [Catenovulum agarivorans]|uniref:GGDEF domain-containing protein n=1 Tax=Catenovulum agarivorans TaxID=1172192 RepID=UPI000317E5BA|nr:GGDEF domain-containing protein [Catenovulum agarivorans]
MSADSTQFINKLVDVTNVKDRLSLDQIMLFAIDNLLKSANVIIYRAIPHVDSFYYVVSKLSDSLPTDNQELITQSFHQVHQDRLITKCYSTKQTQQDDNRSIWYLAKLGIHYGFIEVNGLPACKVQQSLVESMVAIYCNLSYLINEAEKDTLTGLFNRKTLDSHLTQLLGQAFTLKQATVQQGRNENQQYYWIALVDIDHFKRVNDAYGHAYGDEVIITIAKIMQQNFRKEDLLFRYGGEEFIAIIDATTEDTALMVLNRFRQSVAQFNFPTIGQVTVSAGITKVDLACPATTLVGQADKALYFSKHHGRNCVSYYQDLVQHGKVAEPRFDNDIELF